MRRGVRGAMFFGKAHLVLVVVSGLLALAAFTKDQRSSGALGVEKDDASAGSFEVFGYVDGGSVDGWAGEEELPVVLGEKVGVRIYVPERRRVRRPYRPGLQL